MIIISTYVNEIHLTQYSTFWQCFMWTYPVQFKIVKNYIPLLIGFPTSGSYELLLKKGLQKIWAYHVLCWMELSFVLAECQGAGREWIMLMMMTMMNCFCGMVDRRKTFSLISSRDQGSGLAEWNCAVVITAIPQCHNHEMTRVRLENQKLFGR